MFQVFNFPRANYSYYRPTIYRRRYVPVENYLLNSIREVQEYENLKSILYNSMICQRQNQPKQNVADKQNENINYNINEQQTEEKQKEVPAPSPIYYYESHSRFDGNKLVVEKKERRIDSEGKVHQKLQRRLGDQWYETERIEDKDGQIVNKEAWHNVSENEVENFKKEWLSKSGYMPELTQNCNEQPESDEKEIEQKPIQQEETKNDEIKDNEVQLNNDSDEKSSEIEVLKENEPKTE